MSDIQSYAYGILYSVTWNVIGVINIVIFITTLKHIIKELKKSNKYVIFSTITIGILAGTIGLILFVIWSDYIPDFNLHWKLQYTIKMIIISAMLLVCILLPGYAVGYTIKKYIPQYHIMFVALMFNCVIQFYPVVYGWLKFKVYTLPS